MDTFIATLAGLAGFIFGSFSWLLIAVAIFNKRFWSWWRMTKWVGNVMLALLSMLAGFAAFYARFLVQNFLGYTGADTFTSVYRTNNFLDLALLKGLTHFAQILLSNGHVEAVSDNVGQLAKFVVEVIFFGLIWSVRVRFSGEKRNVEP